jgi:thiol-disulfide isomerase/thioredoxin
LRYNSFRKEVGRIIFVKRASAFLIILAGISGVLLPPVWGGFEGGGDRSADLREAGSRRDPEVLDLAGTRVHFSSFLGSKPLVVVFWASWCPECQADVPALNRLANDPAIRLLAVDVGESEKKVQSFISSFFVNYQVVRDPGWQTTTAFKIVGVPTCILLGKGGEILYRGSSVPGNIEAYVRK